MALSFKVSKLEVIDEELEMGENNTCQGEILRLAKEQSPTDQDTMDVFNKGKNILGKNRTRKHRKYDDNKDEDNKEKHKKDVAREDEDKRFESNEDKGRNDENRDKDMDGDKKYENKDVNNKAVNDRNGNNKDEDNKDTDNEDEPREKDESKKDGDKKYKKKDKSNKDEDNKNGKYKDEANKDEANKDEIISEENLKEENKTQYGTNQNENYDHISVHEMHDIPQEGYSQNASFSETGVSTEEEGFNIDHLKAKIYSAFSWDNFFYAIIFGLGPTAWDVFSDLRFGHHLTEAGDIHSAGLCYLFVNIPGLFCFQDIVLQRISRRFGWYVTTIVYIVGSIFSTTAMVFAFLWHPLLFKYPAIIIGCSVIGVKLVGVFVHTPEMKAFSIR